ncbi:MAG: HD domain-containing protein [Methylotenera sp.]|nr:HD domain-containing protein [Oligoflexia bacterium]
MSRSFFAVAFQWIIREDTVPYDLYINSSALEEHERFVRIFPEGGYLSLEDLFHFKEKYGQFYILEDQRPRYLESLCKLQGKSTAEKTTVLKNSAIQYLGNLFNQKQTLSVEALSACITDSRAVITGFVGVLKDYNVEKLQELLGGLSFHDFYTYDHSINVSMYSILIYRLVHPDATEEQLINAGMSGMLHDIGKIQVPVTIINNSGKLNEADYLVIKKHPKFGYDLLNQNGMETVAHVDLNLVSRVVHEHHENFDGSGYPKQLSGEQIHELSRIVSIADFFDAVTSQRSYQSPLSTQDALSLMKKTRGKKIDPGLFDRFVSHMSDYKKDHDCKINIGRDFDPCQPSPLYRIVPDYGKIVLKK